MFGKVLNKLFKRGAYAKAAPVVKSSGGSASAASSPFARSTAVAPPPEKGRGKGSPPERAAESVKEEWKSKSSRKISSKDTPEALCGINQNMPKDQIRDTLASLYRRHNRAASSLDPVLREEAETMLEAIATMKERHLG